MRRENATETQKSFAVNRNLKTQNIGDYEQTHAFIEPVKSIF